MEIEAPIVESGNSLVLRLSKKELLDAGLEKGDLVNAVVQTPELDKIKQSHTLYSTFRFCSPEMKRLFIHAIRAYMDFGLWRKVEMNQFRLAKRRKNGREENVAILVLTQIHDYFVLYLRDDKKQLPDIGLKCVENKIMHSGLYWKAYKIHNETELAQSIELVDLAFTNL